MADSTEHRLEKIEESIRAMGSQITGLISALQMEKVERATAIRVAVNAARQDILYTLNVIPANGDSMTTILPADKPAVKCNHNAPFVIDGNTVYCQRDANHYGMHRVTLVLSEHYDPSEFEWETPLAPHVKAADPELERLLDEEDRIASRHPMPGWTSYREPGQ